MGWRWQVANANPFMNFYHLKLVYRPHARPKIKIDCTGESSNKFGISLGLH